MKLSPYLSKGLAGSAFLLAGSFVLAQTTSAARNIQPRAAASGQSAGRQAQPGSTPGMAVNEQGSRGHNGIPAQSIAVDHAGGNGVRRADTDKSGDNPLYEGKGQANLKSGASAAQSRKHIAGVKYEDRLARDNPGGAAGQSTTGRPDRKSISVVILADKGSERHTAGNPAHATEPLGTSDNTEHMSPLYKGNGRADTNRIHGPSKIQNAGTTDNPNPPTAAQSRVPHASRP